MHTLMTRTFLVYPCSLSFFSSLLLGEVLFDRGDDANLPSYAGPRDRLLNKPVLPAVWYKLYFRLLLLELQVTLSLKAISVISYK